MYYVTRNGEQFGPYDKSSLTTMVSDGTFTASDFAWMEGMPEWRPLSDVVIVPRNGPPAFSTATMTATAPAQNANQHLLYESQKKSPGLACFLNFILPGVGYMYAGRVILGLFVFGAWLVCMCLFFLVIPIFIAAIIWLVGLIDGYLATERHNRVLAASLLR